MMDVARQFTLDLGEYFVTYLSEQNRIYPGIPSSCRPRVCITGQIFGAVKQAGGSVHLYSEGTQGIP